MLVTVSMFAVAIQSVKGKSLALPNETIQAQSALCQNWHLNLRNIFGLSVRQILVGLPAPDAVHEK